MPRKINLYYKTSRSTGIFLSNSTSFFSSNQLISFKGFIGAKEKEAKTHKIRTIKKSIKGQSVGPGLWSSLHAPGLLHSKWLPLTWSASAWTPGDWAGGTSCWTAATAPLGIRMSWEARGTFRPKVRLTCNRFPSCGWQGEEVGDEKEEKRRQKKWKERTTRQNKQQILNKWACPFPHQPKNLSFSKRDDSSRRKPRMYRRLQNDNEDI